MKKLFTAIRKNDYATVKQLLDKNPELVSCVSQGAPRKEDGQSPLQVALKSSSDEIVHLLLENGADVNFIEDENCINPWRTPVLHDAINRAIMSSRWNVKREEDLEVFGTEAGADAAFAILKKMLELGADVNGKDSYGNACMDRACLQARQILPHGTYDDRVVTPELRRDLARIFDLLLKNGADMGYIAPNAFGKTYAEQYGDEVLGEFINYN